MDLRVIHWDPVWGPLSETAMRSRLAARGFHVSRYDYAPGTYFPPHTHSVHKCDAVLAGRLRIAWPASRECAAGSIVLAAGDTIEIPAGTTHSAEVLGNETVVSMDATKPA